MTRQRATRFLCLLVAILVAASSAGQQGSTTPVAAEEKQQILDLEQEWVTAEIRHDATTLDLSPLSPACRLTAALGPWPTTQGDPGTPLGIP